MKIFDTVVFHEIINRSHANVSMVAKLFFNGPSFCVRL